MTERGERAIDVICPTLMAQQILVAGGSTARQRMLDSYIGSLFRGVGDHRVRLILVNNGEKPIETSDPRITVINAGENLGWEGGLARGLQESDARFVCFSNDDVYFLPGQRWPSQLMIGMLDETVGAIGPSSNVIMGPQNIFEPPYAQTFEVNFLIGLFICVRRAALEKAGGIDTALPGGDDLDLSIRLVDAGYKLLCRKDLFVFHHGYQTGCRVKGPPEEPGGWNSPQMTQKTNEALIAKHGRARWQKLFGALPTRAAAPPRSRKIV